MSGYTAQEVARMMGLTAGRLRAYLRSGVLSPERGARGELRFSFQDLLLLRTAEGLVRERIPPRRVRRALQLLRARMPGTRPLTGLQLSADGTDVVVRDGGARWQVESGQVLLDFERGGPTAEAPLSPLAARRAAADAVAALPSPAARAPMDAEVIPLSLDELY